MADDKPPLPGGASSIPPPRDAIAPAPPGAVPGPPPGAIAATPMTMPPIALDGPAKPTAAPAAKKPDTDVKDTFRELIETVVFVVVLVLMLKTFLAEAFVIPTGSMAKTLLGYHYKVTCEQCGYVNWVNASKEAEHPPRDEKNRPRLLKCRCQNCAFINETARPEPVRGGPP